MVKRMGLLMLPGWLTRIEIGFRERSEWQRKVWTFRAFAIVLTAVPGITLFSAPMSGFAATLGSATPKIESSPPSGYGAGSGFCSSISGNSHTGYNLGASFNNVYACGPTLGYNWSDEAYFQKDFQCTELAARYLWAVESIDITGYGNGADFASYAGNQTHIPTQTPAANVVPVPGDVISMWGNSSEPAGHVAIVTAVSAFDANGDATVSLMEENGASDGANSIAVSGHGASMSYDNGFYTSFKWLTNGRLPDGSFVQTPEGTIYRVAGGAALHITNCGAIPGGCGTPTQVANLNEFAPTVSDNENLVQYDYGGGGYVKAVGGTLIGLSTCSDDNLNYCSGPTVVVNDASINEYNAQHPTVADNELVVVYDTPGGGGYLKAVGGTLIGLSTCGDDNLNYCSGPTVVMPDVSINDYDSQHPTVADNELVIVYDAPGGGGYLKAVGGTLIGLSTCGDDNLNYCSGPTVVMPDVSIKDYNAQHPTVADNEVLIQYDYNGGGYLKAAGGTILPLASCRDNVCSGPTVVMPNASINDYIAQHPTVANNEVLIEHDHKGFGYWKAAGGAILPLSKCTSIPNSTQTVCSGPQVTVNYASIVAYNKTHTRPANGTLLWALPSGSTWLYNDGCRSSVASSAQAVAVNKSTIAAFEICVQVTTKSLPDATKGQSYSQTLGASGGMSPYAWTLVSGSLPPGLHISKSGVISGVPTKKGTFNFTVMVTDSSDPSLTATKTFSLDVT
jgi:surface antigen